MAGSGGTALDGADVATWRAAVAAVLAKSRRVDPESLGPEPEKLLDVTTYDGTTISPLYTSHDEQTEPAAPGAFPFVRGTTTRRAGWHVAEKYIATSGNEAALNVRILDGLYNGVSAVWVNATEAIDLAAALKGVLLDLAPVTLTAGNHTDAIAEQLFALLDARRVDQSPAENADAIDISLGAAPLTSAVSGAADVSLEKAIELAVTASARPETVRALTVDGTAFHNLGASDAQEIAGAVAVGVRYLRLLADSGLSIHQALRQIDFRFAASDDQFATIAKLRAVRQLWARVAQLSGAADAGRMRQHAVTSAAMMTQRDPWVNQLRTTVASMAAGIGGADLVTALPLDAAISGGAANLPTGFTTRLARNTQLIALEESHLGHVIDPAGGSWFVERATADVAAAAWTLFQRLEAHSDADAAMSELIAAIEAVRESRLADVATRRTSITGVNEFPDLSEAPLNSGTNPMGLHRYAADFETLRNRSDAYLTSTGARPSAALLALGPIAEHTARVTFSANLLASGGISTLTITDTDGVPTGSSLAVICGSDARYAQEGSGAIDRLRAAGVTTIYVAGPESSWPTGESGRPDGFLTLKINAVATLDSMLTVAGA